jgi:hypothetical protein
MTDLLAFCFTPPFMRARVAQTLDPLTKELLVQLLRYSIDYILQLVVLSSVAVGPCILSLTNESSELICDPRLVA